MYHHIAYQYQAETKMELISSSIYMYSIIWTTLYTHKI